MAESSPLQSNDEHQLLQAALEHPFEPTEVPLVSTTSESPPSPPPSSAPAPVSVPPTGPTPSEAHPTEDDTWQSTYTAQVSEWRAQSASVRNKAELARAKWEAIRAREKADRQALGQPPESWDSLGDHITASVATAEQVVSHSLSASAASFSSVEHVAPHAQPEENAERAGQEKTDGSPSQPWEHLPSSPTSSYPSMSFPEASVPQSPSHQHGLLAPTSASAPVHTHPTPRVDRNPTHVPPSTLPSIMDNRVARRTRLSLVLSSLAINLLLPFINGVMLGFGEIFAKEVVGWFGWKSWRGSRAAGLGLRR